ncbi:hypothetical protein U3516DRAFT_794601 [Neocallimastix sp. 'constans']
MVKDKYILPETDTEKELCQIFSEVFNIDISGIGKMTDFYEIGGDSLNAIRVSSEIEKKFSVNKQIELRKDENINNGIKIEKISKMNSKTFPVTSQQLGVYFDSIKYDDKILRSRYYQKEVGSEMQVYGVIDDNCTLEFEEYSYENATEFIRPFNLSKAPLIHFEFINNEVLLIDIHHIICNGMSFQLILKYINDQYNSKILDDIEIDFIDYAIYQNRRRKTDYYVKLITITSKRNMKTIFYLYFS